ncbi:PAAR domain-containing protein [Pseudomonas sp.]|uniref:PAAR domain-containing protein n=1 Tax=Pseudomonas sp. TaxID=306 RepID=UPI002625827F|nr:PAAR domain-containing protein [Pseudomonas sp.]
MSGKPAARLNDPTACPIPGHGTNPITAGSADVLFDGLPAARMGDPTGCGSALAGAVIPTVLINGKPATTVGTVGSHGNSVTAGSGTVIIGTSGGGAAFSGITTLASHLVQDVFDERILLIDSASGTPIADYPYFAITSDGTRYSGRTDAQGNTKRMSTAQASDISISWGDEALYKQDEI